MSARTWRLGLLGVGGLALAARAVYVLRFEANATVGLDRLWYELMAGQIADGNGVVDLGRLDATGTPLPTAWRPPGYAAVLAVLERLGGDHRTYVWFGALVGTGTCVLTAALGARLLDRRTGLVAGGLLAVNGFAVATDGAVMSEVLTVPLVVAALLAVLAATGADAPDRSPRALAAWVAFGALVGGIAWVRFDAVVVPVAVAAVLAVAGRGRAALAGVSVAGLVAAAVFLPWPLRNLRELDSFTPSTTAAATALAGANCPSTWSGPLLGYWDHACTRPDELVPLGEVGHAALLREDAIDHVTDEWPRLPLVVTVRVLRLWGAWDPVDQSALEAVESRHLGWQRVAWVTWTPVGLLALAAIGRRRSWPSPRGRLVVVTSFAALTATMLVGYGNQRFRAPVEPLVAIAAAATAAELVGRRAGDGASGERAPGDEAAPVAADTAPG